LKSSIPPELKELIQKAQEAKVLARAPYSGFRVGAALLGKSGRIYTGCNLENLSLSLSLCAERIALIKALSEGEKEFEVLALTSDAFEPVTPCGACRQMLIEYAPSVRIISLNRSQDNVMLTSIQELLPHPFKL
jgi:cytidine deaminase